MLLLFFSGRIAQSVVWSPCYWKLSGFDPRLPSAQRMSSNIFGNSVCTVSPWELKVIVV